MTTESKQLEILPMQAVGRTSGALRWNCMELKQFHAVRGVVDHMFTVMSHWGGIGLAANQLGLNMRIIVVKVGPFKQAIINPVITKRYGGKHTAREGCLSFGPDTALVVRDRKIIVEGFDDHLRPVRFKLKQLAARCVQHEVDHLNGITIL